MYSDDADDGLDISAHVNKVRAVFERMDHTFSMARARSDLRTTINGLHQNSATSTAVCEGDDKVFPSGDDGKLENGRKEASILLQTVGWKARVA